MAKAALMIDESSINMREGAVTMEYRWIDGRRRLTIKLDPNVFVPRARGVVGGTGVDQIVVDFGVGEDMTNADRGVQYTFETNGKNVIYDRTR